MDVKTLCLGVLTQGDASGYEIKKQLEEGPLAYFYRAGFGSIYPALNGLDEAGLVTSTHFEQERRPGKTVYRITEKGIAAFREALREAPGGDRIRSDYLFLMFFGEFLDSGRIETVYETYLAQYREVVGRMCCSDLAQLPPGKRFVHAFGLNLYTSIIEFMENNRHLLADDDGDASGERRNHREETVG